MSENTGTFQISQKSPKNIFQITILNYYIGHPVHGIEKMSILIFFCIYRLIYLDKIWLREKKINQYSEVN